MIPPWRLAPSATSPRHHVLATPPNVEPSSSVVRPPQSDSLGIQLIMRAPRAGLVFALNQSAQQIRGANSSAMISPWWNAPSRPG